MKRIAIVAALPGELQPLVRGWPVEMRDGVEIRRHRQGHAEWLAACAGMGVAAAEHAFSAIATTGAIDAIVSIGWAGALRADCAVGRAYRVSAVIDAGTGERLGTADVSADCVLVTASRVADAAAKRRLCAAYEAALVDLEAAGLARIAASRGIPFYGVKGVSDGPADTLPDFNPFITGEGRFRTASFVRFALFRPWIWHTLLRMSWNSSTAAEDIRRVLLQVLDCL